MSDCGCDKALRELEEFLRHELCAEDEFDVRAHVEHCPDCQDELQVQRKLMAAVQRACQEQAPQTLRLQVLQAVRHAHEA